MHVYADEVERTINSVASQLGFARPSELNVYGYRFLVCSPMLEQQLVKLQELGLIDVKHAYCYW